MQCMHQLSNRLDTLRSALSYIQHLGRLLKDDDQTADKSADTPILPVRLVSVGLFPVHMNHYSFYAVKLS